jgi:diguanylate cyclase (GGDEF)-like protein
VIANRISIRVILAGAVFVMGNLAIVLVYVSGTFYRDDIIGNQRTIVAELVGARIRDIDPLLARDADTALRPLQVDARLPELLQRVNFNGATLRLKAYLDRPDGQRNEQVGYYLFDEQLRFGGQFSRLGEVSLENLCPRLMDGVRQTPPTDAMPFNSFCSHNGKLLYISVAPSLQSSSPAYIGVVLDVAPRLRALFREYGMPARISAANGAVLFQSSDWRQPTPDRNKAEITVPLKLRGIPGVTYASVVRDLTPLLESLSQTSYLVIIAAAVVTILTILISMGLLQRAALDPLTELTLQVRRIRQDQTQLGRRVAVGGNAEVYELAEGFNEMTSKLREMYESLERMAFMDALTKLPNRALFNDRLEQAILAARRQKRHFAVMIMDLDRFKEINDTLGHHVGDTLLQQVGLRLLDRLRETDTVARLGGDEFAMLLQDADNATAMRLANAIQDVLRKPFDVGQQALYVSGSLGISVFPQHGETTSSLMQKADIAMYAAKNTKIGAAVYEEVLDRDSSSKLELLGELRRALDIKEFELYYQPKVDLQSLEVEGVEALIRWRRDGIDISRPDVFVPMLEQTGQIRELTAWVIESALSQCEAWRAMGHDVRVSVNLSARDLLDSELPLRLSSLLARHKVSPRMLELEITESTIMDDPLRALDTLNAIAGMGVGLAIDDFGTGYSSLAYLKRLPAHAVKIDKSFVVGMEEDPSDATIVRTSIDLAHNLGLKVVAEGVESFSLMNLLAQQGCDSAQGYFISAPMSADDFIHWLNQSPWRLRVQQFRPLPA